MRLRPKTERERQVEAFLTRPVDHDHRVDTRAYGEEIHDYHRTRSMADVMREHGRINLLGGMAIGLFLGTALLLAAQAWWNAGYCALACLACVGLMVTHRRLR